MRYMPQKIIPFDSYLKELYNGIILWHIPHISLTNLMVKVYLKISNELINRHGGSIFFSWESYLDADMGMAQ
jgi:hypothetical protein